MRADRVGYLKLCTRVTSKLLHSQLVLMPPLPLTELLPTTSTLSDKQVILFKQSTGVYIASTSRGRNGVYILHYGVMPTPLHHDYMTGRFIVNHLNQVNRYYKGQLLVKPSSTLRALN